MKSNPTYSTAGLEIRNVEIFRAEDHKLSLCCETTARIMGQGSCSQSLLGQQGGHWCLRHGDIGKKKGGNWGQKKVYAWDKSSLFCNCSGVWPSLPRPSQSDKHRSHVAQNSSSSSSR